MRLTYRTVRVLLAIAETPGASNRELADAAGVADQGQISKLLSRLKSLGLIENIGAGPVRGEPNAWQLTPKGSRSATPFRSRPRASAGPARRCVGRSARMPRLCATALEIVLWIALALIVWTQLGYALVLALLARVLPVGAVGHSDAAPLKS